MFQEIIVRKLNLRCSATLLVTATVALTAQFAAPLASATETVTSNNAGCHQETRRVAVWPRPPKAVRIARYETRTVTICDGKRVRGTSSTSGRK